MGFASGLRVQRSAPFAEDPTFRSKYDHINPVLKLLSFEDLDATTAEDVSPEGLRAYKDFYHLQSFGKISP